MRLKARNAASYGIDQLVKAASDVESIVGSVHQLHLIMGRTTIVLMSDVTRILSQIESGDPSAAEQLLPLVYDELRKLAAARLAQEKPGQTLQATALVHDAYLRLVDTDKAQHWNSRGHFFSAAAEAMRRILLNRARDKNRCKRGGHMQKIDLDNVEIALETPDEELLALDEALERLGGENKVCADLVKLRFFAGLSIRDAAAALGISTSTADRYWAYARAWLFAALRPDGGKTGQ
jgi:RNA polymerase sigma factor (TIGR02999 family)